MKNKAVLEGLLFVVGEDGLTLDQIEEVLEVKEEEAKQETIQESFETGTKSNKRGVQHRSRL